MKDELRPYPEYKSVDIPWLDKVPAHWKMQRMKHLFAQRNIRGFPHEPMLAATQTKGVVRKDEYEIRTVLALKDLHLLKLVEIGDFVISLRSFQGGIEYARHRGIISPAYTILYQNDDLDHGYYASLFKSRPFIGGLRLYVTGIRQGQNIDYTRLSRSYLPLPPLIEQKAISAYVKSINHRCARFIRNRRRLIEVLNEQKQAIINRAVTRGLDPDVPLKHSRVDWLGEIPKSWVLKRFKYVVSIRSGQVDPKVAPYRDWVLIAPEHIEKHTGAIRLREAAHEQGAISGKYHVEPGEVMYSKIRPALRKAAIAEEKCLCSADMYPLAPLGSEILPEYLLLLLLYGPATRYLIDCSMRVAMPKVNRDALGNCWLWYPDVDTQREIILSLKDELLPLNTSLDHAQREIDLIREYRTRLISDVVTGKVDVRHLAPPPGSEDLKDTVEELEPLEEDIADAVIDDEESVNEPD